MTTEPADWKVSIEGGNIHLDVGKPQYLVTVSEQRRHAALIQAAPRLLRMLKNIYAHYTEDPSVAGDYGPTDEDIAELIAEAAPKESSP